VESCDWVEDDDDQIEINENFQMELKNILEKLKTDLNLDIFISNLDHVSVCEDSPDDCSCLQWMANDVEGMLCDGSNSKSLLTGLLIHSTWCVIQHCRVIGCQLIKPILLNHLQHHARFNYGQVLYSTTRWFETNDLLTAGDYQIYYRESIDHHCNVSYEWLSKNSHNVAMAVKEIKCRSNLNDKQSNCEVASDIVVATSNQHTSHPNILTSQLILRVEDCMHLLFMKKGDCTLHTYIQSLRESGMHLPLTISVKIMYQILTAISYLHQRNMVHRDIKSKNIVLFYGGMNVKLIDFDTLYMCNGTNEARKNGTLGYAAYESLGSSKITGAVDIYSFGVLASEILLLTDMEMGKNSGVCCQKLCQRDKQMMELLNGMNPPLDSILIDVIASCLQVDPTKRPSADELCTKFNEDQTLLRYREYNSMDDFVLPMNSCKETFKEFNVKTANTLIRNCIEEYMKELDQELPPL